MNKRGARALTFDVVKVKNIFPKSKRSQLTIFVILALIIVAVIAVFVLFKSGKIPILNLGKVENPQSFMSACLEDEVREAIKIIPLHGGYVKNLLNKSFKLDNEAPIDIAYLCYTEGNVFPCVNKEPALFSHLQIEIKNYLSESVQTCFNNLVSSFEKQGYSVTEKYNGFDVRIESKRVAINIDAGINLVKAEESTKYSNFKIEKSSRLYELISVVQEAVNKEASEECNFDYAGYMYLYQQFDIKRFPTRDSSKIYIVKHKNTDEEFRFAVRGCVMPVGF